MQRELRTTAPSASTRKINTQNCIEHVTVAAPLAPFALYEIPKGTTTYKKVVFEAQILSSELHLRTEEIRALVALTIPQIIASLAKPMSLSALIENGAEVIIPHPDLKQETLLYPIGTASALARLLQTDHAVGGK